MFEFAPTCFQAVAISKKVVTSANIPLLWTRIAALSPRLASPLLLFPAPSQPYKINPPSKPSLPGCIKFCLTLISRVSIFTKNYKSKIKINFQFWFLVNRFLIINWKNKLHYNNFPICLLRQNKFIFRRTIFI